MNQGVPSVECPPLSALMTGWDLHVFGQSRQVRRNIKGYGPRFTFSSPVLFRCQFAAPPDPVGGSHTGPS